MNAQPSEVEQRLSFIDRTIHHAAQACHSDMSIPNELKDFVYQLGLQANQAIRALSAHDAATLRRTIDRLAQLSFHAQNALHNDVNYDVKSAVILAHLELSALRHQLG